MKLLGTFILALALLGTTTLANTLDSEMRELERRWNEAHLKGDVSELNALWSDDLLIVVPSMQPMSKTNALEFWKRVPVLFETYESEIISARPIQQGAIVIGRLHRVRNFGGRLSEDHWTFTKVYSRKDGQWQVLVYHASPSPTE